MKSKGFTLIEVMICLAIVGIVVAVVLGPEGKGGPARGIFSNIAMGVTEVKLQDGTRCAVARTGSGVSIDCDWRKPQ